MKASEAVDLIAVMGTVDPRAPKPSMTVAKAWAQLMPEVPVEFALTVVHQHYRTNSDTVMPSAIVNAWRNHRRDLSARDLEREQPRAEFNAEVNRRGIDRVVAELATRRAVIAGEDGGDSSEIALAQQASRHVLRSVACPHCKARPGAPCTRNGRGNGLRLAAPHPSRAVAARDAGVETTAYLPLTHRPKRDQDEQRVQGGEAA